MNNNLLIDDYPLLVLPSLAVKIGLHESIVLQQIHYWLIINESKQQCFEDGHYWTFSSYENFVKQFPFWNVRTIQGIILKLENKGYLISANYNKYGYDKTKWYRIDYRMIH